MRVKSEDERKLYFRAQVNNLKGKKRNVRRVGNRKDKHEC